MAITKITTPTALAGILVTSDNVTASANDNVTGNNSGRIYQVQVDNTGNTVTSYLKILDASSATPGTSNPDLTLAIPAAKKVTYNMDIGHPYASGVSLWCTAGAEVGNTQSPGSVVAFALLAS